MMMQLLRLLVVLVSIGVYLLHMSMLSWWVPERWTRYHQTHRWLSRYVRWGLYVLRVHVAWLGEPKHGLYVGNHLSYLDILVFSSRISTGYVTSVEIRETPVLGRLCELAGCLFVERRSKLNLRQEIQDLKRGLQEGLNVTVFPEATSTNGEGVLRFRRPLFQAAVEASVPVIPFTINYRRIGGHVASVANRDLVCWYGDMDFLPHLWALCGAGPIEVEVSIHSSLSPALCNNEPEEISSKAHTLVAQSFTPFPERPASV
jgi:lyso-ornithine lipid O-acyltransferase